VTHSLSANFTILGAGTPTVSPAKIHQLLLMVFNKYIQNKYKNFTVNYNYLGFLLDILTTDVFLADNNKMLLKY